MSKADGKILIIDDDQAVLYTARLLLKQEYAEVTTESSPSQIPLLLQKKAFDVVLLDMNFAKGKTSGQEGLFWMKEILAHDAAISVVVTTAYGDIDLAVSAMKEGAVDFLLKPWGKEKLFATIQAAFHLGRSKREVTQLKHRQRLLHQEIDSAFADVVSVSAAMQEIFSTVEKVAPTDANVLVLGENGTGKELIARAIHRHSTRRQEAFVKVDIGAIAETLFESEIFGHVKGAFSGALEDRAGRFEVASGGTLFLDEMGNISLQLQAKLLTALQSRQVIRVGDNAPVNTDIRLVCATNKPLHTMCQEEPPTFRQDLLYRINTVEITVPPLRERREDIPVLLKHFLQVYGKKYRHDVSINQKALHVLQQYAWPGNVRELQHATERAVIMHHKGSLQAADFLMQERTSPPRLSSVYRIETVEKNTIEEAIRKYAGNLSEAAKALGLGRSTLYRKMKKYGL